MTKVGDNAFLACASIRPNNQNTPYSAHIELAAAGIDVNETALRYLRRTMLVTVKETVGIVRTTPHELGVEAYASIEVVLSQAIKSGLKLCPPELGYQIWHQQPSIITQGDCVILGMKPLLGLHGEKRVWCLGHDLEERWLSIPVCVHWHPRQSFFFCLD